MDRSQKEAMLQAVQDGICIIDSSFRILQVNRQAALLFHRHLPLEGKYCHQVFFGSDAPCRSCPAARCMDSGSLETEQKSISASNGYRKIEVSAYPVTDHAAQGITGAAIYLRDVTELREAEKNIPLVQHAMDLLFIADSEGCFTFVNPSWEKTLGWSREELLGKPWNSFVHPDDRESAERISAESRSAKDTSPPAVRFICKDGSAALLSWNTYPDPDTDGFYGAAREIPEYAEYEFRYRNLFQQMTEGFVLCEIELDASGDPADARFLEVNPAFERMTGLSADQIENSRMSKLFPSSARDWILQCRQTLLTGEPAQFEHFAQEIGKHFSISIFHPREHLAACFILDSSVLAAYRHDLEYQRNIFQNLFESSPDAIAFLDGQDRIIEVNHSFTELFGYTTEETKGQYINKLIIPPEYEEDAAQVTSAVTKGEFIREETIRCCKDGSRIEVELLGYPSFIGGTQVGTFGIYKDISERKQLEAQLLQSQKMESIGRLAGGVAHDFNNMLGVILGRVEIVREMIEEGSSLHEEMEEIHKAASYSADLTRQLLAFSKQQIISPEILELNTVIANRLTMLRRLIGEHIELLWHPCSEALYVEIDPAQADQIITNICINSRDAIAAAGTITIETAGAAIDEAYTKEHIDSHTGEYAVVSISDTGSGMDRETQERIFEPFFTTKEETGTGLGLSTIFGIVKQNEGFLHVYSEPGRGTTMKIYLPRTSRRKEELQEEEESVNASKQSLGILLVEDNRALRQIAKRMLEKLGHRVIESSGPREALELADDPEVPIDLLFTDVVMPEMNGNELAEGIRRKHRNVRTLFMSGYTTNVIAHQGILEDGVTFLQKPFTLQDVKKKLNEIFPQLQ